MFIKVGKYSLISTSACLLFFSVLFTLILCRIFYDHSSPAEFVKLFSGTFEADFIGCECSSC